MSNYSELLKDPRWQDKRKSIIKRDNYQCQYCGLGLRKLNVHHLIYIKGLKPWEYDNELLITLCDEHHELIHDINKIIAIIAKNVIINKIDLTKLGAMMDLSSFEYDKSLQEAFEHKVNCYRRYGFDKKYFQEAVYSLKETMEIKYNTLLRIVDIKTYKSI